MKAEIKNGKLLIEIDLEPKRSSTGKSLTIASSRGNKATAAVYEGKPVIVGLNAYVQ